MIPVTQVFMRVEEMGRDEPASPNKIAGEIFSKARKNVSELLRGAAVGDLSIQSRFLYSLYTCT